MQCRDFSEVADSYLSDELLIETNHDVIAHLEACNDCRRELTARRELRATLRASFANAEELRVQDEFAARLRTELRARALSETTSLFARRHALIAIAACLLVISTFALIVVWRRQRLQPLPQVAEGERRDSNVAEVKPTHAPPDIAVEADAVLAKMSELAAGDHHDCAINHRLPDSPIDLEEAGRKYDHAYVDLANAVTSHRGDSGEAMKIVMAHACIFKGRWFGHVVVRHRGRLVSLLVTRMEQTDAMPAKRASVGVDPQDRVIACSRAGDYQISCFRTARHAVFVVSELSEAENLVFARRLAAPVYEHITRAEDVT